MCVCSVIFVYLAVLTGWLTIPRALILLGLSLCLLSGSVSSIVILSNNVAEGMLILSV